MNPMTYAIIRHRLFRIIDEAVITLKHVSGSAITNEGHDLMVSLYRADGTLLMGGVGFLHHLTSASEACQAIIRQFEGEIYEDDVFLLNDPYTAALHTSDVYLVAPIHFDGELVAWSACFVHVYDIGALNPGGFSPDSRDIYTEGFSTPGMKIVERGEMVKGALDTMLNMVRSPEMVMLDIRSMIACNNVAADRMKKLIHKYGIETVDKASERLINESEELFRQRLKELPNGQWQSRQYIKAHDEMSKVQLTMTKKNDQITFDFTGTSEQSSYPINCTRWGSLGGLFAPLFPLLCYDISWNEGVIRAVKMIAPEGTVVNSSRPAPVSVATVGAIQSVNNAACTTIGKMLASSEKFEKQATAVWHANHFSIFKFGRNQHKEEAIGIFTETFAGAGGARAFADGVDIGGEIPNPISRMANVETVESTFPIRYLYRRRRKDSGGPGKWRGGVGGEMTVVSHKSPDGGIHYVVSGKGGIYPMSDGLAGGFPGATNRYLRSTENPESINEWEAPKDISEPYPIDWGVYPLMGADKLYVSWNGGGGYGDPLDRNLEYVEKDLIEGLISKYTATEIYGAVLTSEGRVDIEKSLERRKTLKEKRLQGAMV